METITETREHSRELTKTETQIAAAQIIDRMTRVCSAAEEMLAFCRSESFDARDIEAEVRTKHDIPDGIDFYQDEGFFALGNIRFIKPFVHYWVEGSLTGDEMEWMYFHLNALDELDFMWVFLEKTDYSDDAVLEWFNLGTRARRKHRGRTYAEVMLPDWCDEKGNQRPWRGNQ